jgi:DNA invertase Pin-like site-specific DNA recombinase
VQLRIIAYLRVSTQEQADSGKGLAAQRSAIEAEATRRGWSVVEFIQDAGASGKDLDRPGIQTALEALREGRADALVVSKLDRLSRSLLDFAHLLETAREQNWSLLALDAVDTTSAAGEAQASMIAVFAQLERRMISQRTREALAVKRAQGKRHGAKRLVPDEVMTRVLAERKAGRTLQMIADDLNADGIPTTRGGRQWYGSTVSSVLRSAAYEEELAAALT